MFAPPKPRTILALLWTVAFGLGLYFTWDWILKPANQFADSVLLEPRSGGYGPINLSGDPASSGIVMVSGMPGRPWILDVKDRKYSSLSVAAEEHLTIDGLPTEAAITRVFFGESATPTQRTEMAELASLIDDSKQGFRTEVRHFRLLKANPWTGREKSERTVFAIGLLWMIGACVIWMWKK